MLHSHGQRDPKGESPVGDAGPVDVLIRSLIAHDPGRAGSVLAHSVRLSVPTLRIHVMGRNEVAAALHAVIGAFTEVDYQVRSRYLNITRVTDEAVISGVHSRPLLGAFPSHRHAQVPMRLIATHDGTVVTTIDVWPDVDAVRGICDELAHHVDSLAGKTGEMVSALRASIPAPAARLVQGRERELPEVELTVPAPATTRSPSRTDGLRAPVPSRTRRLRGIVAGAVMLAATAAIIGWVVHQALAVSDGGPRADFPLIAVASAPPTGSSPASAGTLGPASRSADAGSAAASPTPSVSAAPTIRVPIRNNQVELSSDLLFETDSSTLTAKAHLALADLISQVRKDHRAGMITVTGYTDDRGTATHNLGLSQRRAEAVAADLRLGLPSWAKVSSRGVGANDSIATNLTAAGRSKNRRVTVTLPKPMPVPAAG